MKRLNALAVLGFTVFISMMASAVDTKLVLPEENKLQPGDVWPYVPSASTTCKPGSPGCFTYPYFGLARATGPLPTWMENYDVYEWCNLITSRCETSWMKGDNAGSEEPPTAATGLPYLYDWMKYLPDNTKLSELSIPGTHDSGTAYEQLAAETVEWTFFSQVVGGIRYFDPRAKDDYYVSGRAEITDSGWDAGKKWLGDWAYESNILGSPLTLRALGNEVGTAVRHGNVQRLWHNNVNLETTLGDMLSGMKAAIAPTETLITRSHAMNYMWTELCRGFCSEIPWGAVNKIQFDAETDTFAVSIDRESVSWLAENSDSPLPGNSEVVWNDEYIELWEEGLTDYFGAQSFINSDGGQDLKRSDGARQYYDPIAAYLRAKFPTSDSMWEKDIRFPPYEFNRDSDSTLNCLDSVIKPGQTIQLFSLSERGPFVTFTIGPETKNLAMRVLDVSCDGFVLKSEPDSPLTNDEKEALGATKPPSRADITALLWALQPELGDYRGKLIMLNPVTTGMLNIIKQDRFSIDAYDDVNGACASKSQTGYESTLPVCADSYRGDDGATVPGKYSLVKEFIDKGGFNDLAKTQPAWTLNFTSGANGGTPLGIAGEVNYETFEFLNTKPSHANVGTLLMDFPAEGLIYRIIKTNHRFDRLIDYELDIVETDDTDQCITVGFWYGTELLWVESRCNPGDEKFSIRAVLPATPDLHDLVKTADGRYFADWDDAPFLHWPAPFTHITVSKPCCNDYDIDYMKLVKREVGRINLAKLGGDDDLKDDLLVQQWGVSGNDAFKLGDPSNQQCIRFEVSGKPRQEDDIPRGNAYYCDTVSQLVDRISQYKQRLDEECKASGGELTDQGTCWDSDDKRIELPKYDVYRQYYGDFYRSANLEPQAIIKRLYEGESFADFVADAPLPVDAEYRWDLDGNGDFEVTGPYARINYQKSNVNVIRLGVFVKKERADAIDVDATTTTYPLLAMTALQIENPASVAATGMVTNLLGSGLRLRFRQKTEAGDWVAQETSVPSTGTTGTFNFTGFSNRDFELSISNPPTAPNQECSVVAGSPGNLGTAGVTDLEVACVTKKYKVNGIVQGLTSSAGLTLTANVVGVTDIPLSANGGNDIPFTFEIPDGSEFKIDQEVGPPNQTCYFYLTRGSIEGADYNKTINVRCGPEGYQVRAGATVTKPTPPFEDERFTRQACAKISVYMYTNDDNDPIFDQDIPQGGGEFPTTTIREGDKFRLHYRSPGYQCGNIDQVDLTNPWQGDALFEETMGTTTLNIPDFACAPKAIRLQGAVRGLAAGNTLTGTLVTWVDPQNRTETPWTVDAANDAADKEIVFTSNAECGMSYELSVRLEDGEIPGALIRQTCSVTENAVGQFGPDQPSPTPVISCVNTDTDGDGLLDAVDQYPNALTRAETEGGALLEVAPDFLSSECSVVSFNEQAFVTPPGYVGTDQALGFSLHGCRTDTEESVDVELDFGIPLPPNGLAYKVDGYSLRLIPGATVRGSSVRYTIVDNGDLDQNNNLGEIEDPVAVLVPPRPQIPALGQWALGLLAALMILTGGAALRRRFI